MVTFNGMVPVRLQQNQKVLRIVWEINRDATLKELIGNTDYRSNEIYGSNTLSSPLYLRIMNSEMVEPIWKNWKISPNPFQDQFCIQCESSIGMECKIEIVDLHGVLLHKEWKSLEKGLNYWCVGSEQLGDQNGMLMYKISSGKLVKQGKLIRQKNK